MGCSHSDHFQGKKPLEHVTQKKSESAGEIHGDELPGHLGSFLEAARDVAALFLIFWAVLFELKLGFYPTTFILIMVAAGLLIWKGIRSSWLAWSKLERLHRVLKEERYEIENHRPQEREELSALYQAKGFQGPLLEEVLDVLMADDERLLKVMMEEEMGLNLENCEHPLKVGSGAALGVLLSTALLIGAHYAWASYGLLIVAVLVMGVSGMFISKLQKNDKTPAFIWNMAIAILIYGVTYFLTKALVPFFIS